MSASDSDDDLLLLGAPIFAKKSRAETRTENSKKRLMETILKESDQRAAQRHKLSECKVKSNISFEDLMKRSEEMVKEQENAKESRQRMNDTVQGSSLYKDNAVPRDIVKARAEAIVSYGNMTLSRKIVINYDLAKAQKFGIFRNHEEALDALQEVFHSMKGTTDKALKGSYKKMVDNMVKSIATSRFRFLGSPHGIWAMMENANVKELPAELSRWLVGVAVSSGLDPLLWEMGNQATASCIVLMKSGKKLFEEPSGSLERLNQILLFFVPQQKEHDKPAGVSTSTNDSRILNLNGLLNLLKLEEPALSQSSFHPTVASEVVGLLSGLLLDSSLTGDSQCYETILNLVYVILGKAEVHFSDGTELNEWLAKTASNCLRDQSSTFPSWSDSVGDVDDSWWLAPCQILVVMRSRKDEPQSPVWAAFLLQMSLTALAYSVGVEDMTSLAKESIPDGMGSTALLEDPLAGRVWFAIFASLAGLDFVEKNMDLLSDDGPRCLAVIHCSFSLILHALDYWSVLLEKGARDSQVKGEFGTKDQAQQWAQNLELFLPALRSISSFLSNLTIRDHYRRSQHIVNVFQSFLTMQVEKAAPQGGRVITKIVQKDVRSYFVDSP